MTPAEHLARRVAEEAHAGQDVRWHLIAEGLAYIDPGTVDCCGERIEDLPDDDMIVHDWADAEAGRECPGKAREALEGER